MLSSDAGSWPSAPMVISRTGSWCARQVKQPDQQEHDEHRGLDKSGPAAFAQRNGPGKEKQGFDIEGREQHCNQIELGGKAQARVAGRNDAGLEWLVLAMSQALLSSRLEAPSMKAHKPATPNRKTANPSMGQARYHIRHAVLLDKDGGC